MSRRAAAWGCGQATSLFLGMCFKWPLCRACSNWAKCARKESASRSIHEWGISVIWTHCNKVLRCVISPSSYVFAMVTKKAPWNSRLDRDQMINDSAELRMWCVCVCVCEGQPAHDGVRDSAGKFVPNVWNGSSLGFVPNFSRKEIKTMRILAKFVLDITWPTMARLGAHKKYLQDGDSSHQGGWAPAGWLFGAATKKMKTSNRMSAWMWLFRKICESMNVNTPCAPKNNVNTMVASCELPRTTKKWDFQLQVQTPRKKDKSHKLRHSG
jgi:hypothetical protein